MMELNLTQIETKLFNELNIRLNDIIYRKITKQDIDELYATEEARQWLIPFYLKKEENHADKHGCYLIENASQCWRIFSFPFNHEHNDIADWFVYLDRFGNIAIIQERFSSLNSNDSELKVLFCSTEILDEIENICSILFYYGFLFEEMTFDEYWKSGYANPLFKYSFTTDKGRYI